MFTTALTDLTLTDGLLVLSIGLCLLFAIVLFISKR